MVYEIHLNMYLYKNIWSKTKINKRGEVRWKGQTREREREKIEREREREREKKTQINKRFYYSCKRSSLRKL